MSFRQMNLDVFAGRPLPHVFFQPRVEPWFDWHNIFHCMPPAHQDQSLQEFYDDLRISMRYVDYYTGMPHPVQRHFSRAVKIHECIGASKAWRIYTTPYGDLVEEMERTVDATWRVVKFPVHGPDDLKKLRWLFGHLTYRLSVFDFDKGCEFIGDRGEPQFYLPKSPYLALAQQWMKLPDLIYALADDRGEVEATMAVIDEAYDQLYEEVIASEQVRIVNFGENLHEQHLSARYLEQYLLPWYAKRAGQLRDAGIYTHVHIDGYFRHLLKYLPDMPFDGIEALTPVPQGDMTLDAIQEYLGDKILLDGIPAVLFMADYSREELMATVEDLVARFHPRLVLGVSDEVPEGADEEAIARVRMVAEWCLTHG
jgi:hypothetical protein